MIKNNSNLHVQIPCTEYSLRPYRSIIIPDGEYDLPKELEVVKEFKKKVKGDK